MVIKNLGLQEKEDQEPSNRLGCPWSKADSQNAFGAKFPPALLGWLDPLSQISQYAQTAPSRTTTKLMTPEINLPRIYSALVRQALTPQLHLSHMTGLTRQTHVARRTAPVFCCYYALPLLKQPYVSNSGTFYCYLVSSSIV